MLEGGLIRASKATLASWISSSFSSHASNNWDNWRVSRVTFAFCRSNRLLRDVRNKSTCRSTCIYNLLHIIVRNQKNINPPMLKCKLQFLHITLEYSGITTEDKLKLGHFQGLWVRPRRGHMISQSAFVKTTAYTTHTTYTGWYIQCMYQPL